MEMKSKRKRTGVQFALTAIAATVASSFYVVPAFAQDSAAAEDQQAAAPAAAAADDGLTTIIVTGSRLKRSDVEGALPVTTIDRAQIEATGYQSAADLLRSTTFNTFGSYQSQSGDSFSSNSQVNLRGLGADRTLVLIDGRRVPPSPVTGAAGVDLNTIPLAAIERIDILQDGASAIYGSDAIGGVINIVLRKDINETIVSATAGRPTRKGGDDNSASLISGKSTENGHLLIGLSWQDKQHIALRDRSYSSFFPGDGVNLSTVRGANNVGNTLYGYSSYMYIAGPNCDPSLVYTDDIGGGTDCIFPFANVAWDLTDLRTTSLFANGDQKINDWASVFFQANYSRVESRGRFAPVADAVFLPQGAAANPLNEDAILLHRFQQLGPRNNYDTNTLLDVLLGAKVDVAGVPIEVGYRQSRYNATDIGRNYTNRNIARQYLSDGTYNPYDLTQNSPETIAAMKATIGRDGFYKYQEGYINASFSPMTLPAGDLQVAVGAETRRDQYYDIYDALSEAGQIGGSAGNSAAGKRYANAGYIELGVPVLSNLEFDGALRYDKYGDFGSATTGKLSVRYQPIEAVTVRASYGTGFRAPSLSELYGAIANDAPRIRDLTQCRSANPPIADAACPQTQVNTGVGPDGKANGGFQGSNADLKAEKSDQYSAGIVVAPIKQLDFTVDYYRIKLDDAIQAISYQELIRREADGQSLPSGTSITRVTTTDGSVGRITRIVTGPANVAKLDTSGIDAVVNTHLKLGFGRLEQKLALSYVIEYKDSLNKPGQNQVKDPGVPQYRLNFYNNLNVGPVAFNYNVSFIPKTSALTVPDGTGKEVQQGHVASFIMHDVQVVYTTPFNSELSVGCRNLFDKGPSTNFIGLDNPYYDNTVYNPYGRTPYVSFKQTF